MRFLKKMALSKCSFSANLSLPLPNRIISVSSRVINYRLSSSCGSFFELSFVKLIFLPIASKLSLFALKLFISPSLDWIFSITLILLEKTNCSNRGMHKFRLRKFSSQTSCAPIRVLINRFFIVVHSLFKTILHVVLSHPIKNAQTFPSVYKTL